MEDDDSSLNNPSIYNGDNPSSAKSVRKMVKAQKSNAEAVMAIATKALEKISARYDGSSEKKSKVRSGWGSKFSWDDLYNALVNPRWHVQGYVIAKIATKDYSSKI